MNFSLYAYLWDLVDRPLAESLDHIGALGCTSVTLASAYHAGKFLQPRNRAHRVYFPEDGVIYFRPQARYGEIQPQTSSLLKQDDHYQRICAETDVYAWTVLLHNSRLGQLHPHLTVKNVYGDSYVYSLCPSQAAVQEYAITLCQDLAASYPIKGLVLETAGFLPYTHGYHHEFSQFPLNPLVEMLLGLCFCDACFKSMADQDLDLAQVQTRVKQELDFYLKEAPELGTSAYPWMMYDLLQDEGLGRFINGRSRLVAQLVARIKEVLPKGMPLGCIPSVQQPLGLAWMEGTNYAELARVTDFLELPLYQSNPHQALVNFLMVRQRLNHPKATLSCILRPGLPDMQTHQVAATLTALEQHRVQRIGFYNYGLLTDPNLEGLRALIASKR